MTEGRIAKRRRFGKAPVRKDSDRPRTPPPGSAAVPNSPEASPQYARSLIEASLDPFVTISPEGKITDVNEATVKVTGVPRDELIGTDFSDYFTEPEKARPATSRSSPKGFVTDYPLTIRHRDGRLPSVLYNASVYRTLRGRVLGVFAAARDITAQRQAAQYARSLIEASLDPLVTISPEGKITDVNEATIKVTGVPRDELIGTDFSDYFTEPDEGPPGLPAGLRQGVRHRLPADDPPPGRAADVGPLQRLGLPGRAGPGPGRVRGRARRHGPEAGRGRSRRTEGPRGATGP